MKPTLTGSQTQEYNEKGYVICRRAVTTAPDYTKGEKRNEQEETACPGAGSPDERFHNCGRLRGREHSGSNSECRITVWQRIMAW